MRNEGGRVMASVEGAINESCTCQTKHLDKKKLVKVGWEIEHNIYCHANNRKIMYLIMQLI